MRKEFVEDFYTIHHTYPIKKTVISPDKKTLFFITLNKNNEYYIDLYNHEAQTPIATLTAGKKGKVLFQK